MLKKTTGFLAVLRNKKREESFQIKHKIGKNSFTRAKKWTFHKHSSSSFTFSLPLISQTAFHPFHFLPSTF